MVDLNPRKVHVVFNASVDSKELKLPRKYTLTHSDSTGDLFLTISSDYDFNQISHLYTRFMRDEVLAEWEKKNEHFELHIYLHVSGGFVFGWASLRDRIFRNHLPLVFQTIVYGEKKLFENFPQLKDSQIYVHFKSKNKKYNKIENFGQLKDIHY
ncbi:MAG: staygreen family protein [Promethearchaeota archaeon]|nr:MAG: staygreen family protein [Candidatus Lokiarchaeota archaeon]